MNRSPARAAGSSPPAALSGDQTPVRGSSAFELTFPRPRPGSFADLATVLVLAGGSFAATAALAARQTPELAAETRFLALLGAVVVGTLALGARRATEALAVALFLPLTLWVVPAGIGRGAAASALLAAAVAVAAWRQWPADGETIRWPRWAVLAVAAQVVLRPELLLAAPPSAREWVALAGLPLLATAALCVVAHHRGAVAALTAGTATLLFAPGLNVAATLCLVAFAAAFELRASSSAEGRAKTVRELVAWIALALPLVWEPRAAALSAAAALAVAGFGWRATGVLAAAGLGLLAPARGAAEATAHLSWLLVLAPGAWALAWPSARSERSRAATTACLLLPPLAVMGAFAVPGPAALAPAAGLAALLLAPHREEAAIGRLILAVLFAATALTTGYPWLRADPKSSVLALLGTTPTLAVGVAAGLVLLLAAALARRTGGRRPARWAVAGVLGTAAFLALPGPSVHTMEDLEIVVSTRAPDRRLELNGQRVSEIVIDSHLANAVEIPDGAPIAEIRVEGAGKSFTHMLTAGTDSGEWAERREDLVHHDLATPEPWRHYFDREGSFLAQVYRARWAFPESLAADTIEVRRHAELPGEVPWVISRVEVRR